MLYEIDREIPWRFTLHDRTKHAVYGGGPIAPDIAVGMNTQGLVAHDR